MARATDYIDINDPNHSAIYSHARARRDKKEFVLYFSRNSGQLYNALSRGFSPSRINKTTKSVTTRNSRKPSSEVLIKFDRQAVSKGGGGAKHVINYADYISRNGNVEVFTSDGLIIDNLEDLKAYGEGFIEGQKDLKGLRDKEERLAVNMVLSMNDFYVKDKDDFRKATEAFIKEQIIDKEFECFYAFHSDTDNPHCHVTVGYRSDTGKRFDFNVKDINEMRENYANHLNEFNIEATASPRWVRGEINNSIHRDKYFALLRQPLIAKDAKENFEKMANIFVEETMQGNKFVFRDESDKAKQFTQKRNETLVNFAFQLAEEAKKHDNYKVSDSFTNYAYALNKRNNDIKKAKTSDFINLKDIDINSMLKKRMDNKVRQAQIKNILKYSFTLTKDRSKQLRFNNTEQILSKDGKLYFDKNNFAKEYNKTNPKDNKDKTAIVFEVSNFNMEGLSLPIKADVIVNKIEGSSKKRVMILADNVLSKSDKFKAINAFNRHIQGHNKKQRKRKIKGVNR